MSNLNLSEQEEREAVVDFLSGILCPIHGEAPKNIKYSRNGSFDFDPCCNELTRAVSKALRENP